ncbi:hypothetical protein ACFLTN_06075 [Chloroflexota bacterium]
MIQDLSLLSKAISPYDVSDALAKIAGLKLLPKNASHAIRLEALSFAAACNNYAPDRPKISLRHLKNLVNQHLGPRCSLSLQEDPCENMFTEEFTFYGGSYIVFPGITENPTFILRNLCKGLFLSPHPFLEGTPRDLICLLIIGILALSNEIAIRSGLTRGLEPSQLTWNENLIIPDSKTWSLLQEAVTFDEQEIFNLLSFYRVSSDILDPFIIKAGSIPQKQFDCQASQLMITPIVKVANRLIVAEPGLLLKALLHHILDLAIKHKVSHGLVTSFRAALWDTLIKNLNSLDIRPLEFPFDVSAPNDSFQDGLFRFDSDKMIYLQLISDDLRGYNVNQPGNTWDLGNLPNNLVRRHDEIIEQLLRDHSPPNNILWLITLETLARPVYLALNGTMFQHDVPLAISVADLETICKLEHGDPLALWKYATQKQRIREKVIVGVTSELDEFQIYQSQHHSYYISGDALPNVISIAPGGAGELRRQVFKQRDRHGVSSHKSGSGIEVIRLHEYGQGIPIYVPADVYFDLDQVMFLVEQLPIPIWVIGEEYTEENRRDLYKFYILLADLIAYWLWQFSSSLHSILEPLRGLTSRVLFEIHLTPFSDWYEFLTTPSKEPNKSYPQNVSFAINAQETTIVLDMKPSILQQLKRSDNLGEREVMTTTLVAIRNLLTELGIDTDSKLNDSVIKTIIETYAPLGNKKKNILLDSRINPMLGDEPPNPFRKIQDADKQQILDEIAEQLKSLGYLAGPIPEESRVNLINDGVVEYLYKRLKQIIATLMPDNLISWLISYNEATLWQFYFIRLTTPTRLACFSNKHEIEQKLGEEISEVNLAAISSRFLIEYIAARPPSGLRPISLEVYDLLMAIASLIVDWGSGSDLINYNIADIQLKILPSGRLTRDRDTFITAKQQFMREYMISEIRGASKSFASHWRDTNIDFDEVNSPDFDETNSFAQAFKSEFGFSDMEFALMTGQLYAIGEEQDAQIKTKSYKELIQIIVDNTGIPYQKVCDFIAQLSLGPRADFLDTGPEFKEKDVHPWRFNRALSYLRRPLIKIVKTKDDELIAWGNRHLYNSMFYLENLCMNGRLKAKSDQMSKFIGTIRNRQGRAFNDSIYDSFHRLTNIIVKRRVTKFGKLKMRDSKGDIGDIDVFVADPTRKQILLIECKNLEAARTPYEMDSEIKELFTGSNSDTSKIQKRHNWVKNNLSLVLYQFGLPISTRWKITSIIVVSQELMTSYIKSSPVKVLSFRQLTEEFIPSWCKPQRHRK